MATNSQNETLGLWSRLRWVTKSDLNKAVNKIMSQITDWAAAEDADLTAISGTLNSIVTGVMALDTLITQLQNSPGVLSPADQAALDAIQVKVKSLVTQSAAISTVPPTSSMPPVPSVPQQ